MGVTMGILGGAAAGIGLLYFICRVVILDWMCRPKRIQTCPACSALAKGGPVVLHDWDCPRS